MGCYIAGEPLFSNARGECVVRISPDPETGNPVEQNFAARVPNPSWLHLSEDGRFQYAVSERFDTEGEVHRFAIESDGSLRNLSSQPSLGKATCHLATTSAPLYAALYLDGCLTTYELEENGLSAQEQRIVYEGGGHIGDRSTNSQWSCRGRNC